MDKKEYIKRLWNANTANDIAEILTNFENEVKNNVVLADVITPVCAAPEKILPCSSNVKGKCTHPFHCNFKLNGL